MTYGIDATRQKCSREGRLKEREGRSREEAATLMWMDNSVSTFRTTKALVKLAEAQLLRRLRRNSK